jgi:hypothetical protein
MEKKIWILFWKLRLKEKLTGKAPQTSKSHN